MGCTFFCWRGLENVHLLQGKSSSNNILNYILIRFWNILIPELRNLLAKKKQKKRQRV